MLLMVLLTGDELARDANEAPSLCRLLLLLLLLLLVVVVLPLLTCDREGDDDDDDVENEDDVDSRRNEDRSRCGEKRAVMVWKRDDDECIVAGVRDEAKVGRCTSGGLKLLPPMKLGTEEEEENDPRRSLVM